MKSKKLSILGGLLACTLASGFILLGNTVTAVADTSFAMVDGAQVNAQGTSLRFSAEMDVETYNTLKGKDGAKFGVVIVPADSIYVDSETLEYSDSSVYATEGYELTVANVFGEGAKFSTNPTGTQKLMIDEINNVDVDESSATIYGTIENFQKQNYVRSWVGRAYYYTNETGYVFADWYNDSIENNTRCMYYVAQRAIEENDPLAEQVETVYIDGFAAYLEENNKGDLYRYFVDTYIDGVKVSTEAKYAPINSQVSITPEVKAGCKVNTAESVLSGTVYAAGKQRLSVKYETLAVVESSEVVYLAKNATEFALKTALNGNFVSAEINGQAANVSVNAGKVTYGQDIFPADYKAMGQRELTITTDTTIYKFDAWVVTEAIYTENDLNTFMADNAVSNVVTGYYVLANEINCVSAYPTVSVSFNGIFDGQGYTINGFNLGYGTRGMFNKIEANGVVRNMVFTNAKVLRVVGGLLGYQIIGQIKNIYAQIVQYSTYDINNIFTGALFGAAHVNMPTMYNVIVDVTKVTAVGVDTDDLIDVIYGGNRDQSGYAANQKYYGVYIIGEKATMVKKDADVGAVCANYNELSALNVYDNTWDDDFWASYKGIPYPKNLEKPTINLPVIESDEVVYLAKNATEFTLKTTNMEGNFVSAEIDGQAANVSVSDGKVTYGQDIFPADYKAMGQRELTIKTDEAVYKFNAWVVTQAIYTENDLNTFMAKNAVNNAVSGYYVLANEINCVSAYPTVNSAVQFTGIFNGQGYVIDNFQLGYATRGIFNVVAAGATVENMVFTNAKVLRVVGGLFGYQLIGTVKNVFVELVQYSTYDVNNLFTGALFGAAHVNMPTMYNIIVDATKVTSVGVDTDDLIDIIYGGNRDQSGYAANKKYYGVYIIGPKTTMVKKDADVGAACANYSELAALNVYDNSWNEDFWSLQNGIPYPKNLEMPTLETPVIEASEVVYLAKNATEFTLKTTTLNGNFVSAEIDGTAANVSVNGGKLTYGQDIFPADYKAMGQRELTIITDAAIYKFTAWVVTEAIYNETDLNSFMTDNLVNDAVTGYYVLADDIYCTTVYPSIVKPFNGIFNGLGHKIDGFVVNTTRGIFYKVNTGAVVENMVFTNAKVIKGIGGLLGYELIGTVRNIYAEIIEYSTYDANGTFTGALFGAAHVNMAEMHNVIVDVTKVETVGTASNKLIDVVQEGNIDKGTYVSDQHYFSVYIVGAKATMVKKDVDVAAACTNFDDLAILNVYNNTWDNSFWTVKNGVPYPKTLMA